MLEKEKAKLIKDICLVSLTLSLAIMFLLLANIIVGFDLFLIFIFPFLSTLIVLKTSTKGVLIYLGCLILISFIDLQNGFFSLLPNSLIGIIYGYAIKYFSFNFFTLFLGIIITLTIEVLLIFPIYFIFKVNLVEVYSKIFNLPYDVFKNYFLLFYLAICTFQSLISYLFLSNNIQKFKKIKDKNFNNFSYFFILDIVLYVLFTICYFFSKSFELLFLGLLELVVIYQLVTATNFYSKVNLIFSIASFILGLIIPIFIFSNLHLNLDLAFLTFTIYSSLISLIMLKYPSKNIKKETTKDLLE